MEAPEVLIVLFWNSESGQNFFNSVLCNSAMLRYFPGREGKTRQERPVVSGHLADSSACLRQLVTGDGLHGMDDAVGSLYTKALVRLKPFVVGRIFPKSEI